MTAGQLILQHANIAGARECRRLLRQIKRHQPHAVILTEAYRWAEDVPGYERVTWSPRKHGAEARDVVVLVRHDVPITRRRLKKMVRDWWGVFGAARPPRREPRRYPVLDLDVDGIVWPLLGVHFPPGGPSGGRKIAGRNAGAWHESARKTKRWLARRVLGVAIGDLNADRDDVRTYVAPPGARVAMATSVDGLAAVGATATIRKLRAPAGMHGWFVATLTAKESR